MPDCSMERAADRVDEVAARGHDVVTFWRELSDVLTPVVPNVMGPCCYTLDPASLLVTSHFNPSMYYELPEEMLRAEYYEEDVHDLASVARRHEGYRRFTMPRAGTQARALAGLQTWRWAGTRS